MSSYYPPGHPMGHSTTFEDRLCKKCGHYYEVKITIDYATNCGDEEGSCDCGINEEDEHGEE